MVLSTKHMLDHLMHHIAIVAQEYLLTSSWSVQKFIKPIFYVAPNLFSGALFGWFVNCGVGFWLLCTRSYILAFCKKDTGPVDLCPYCFPRCFCIYGTVQSTTRRKREKTRHLLLPPLSAVPKRLDSGISGDHIGYPE